MKGKTYGVSVSLTSDVIQIVNGYMNRTRKNFSQTMNRIVKEWDEFSMALEKYKREQTADKLITDIKRAEVEK